MEIIDRIRSLGGASFPVDLDKIIENISGLAISYGDVIEEGKEIEGRIEKKSDTEYVIRVRAQKEDITARDRFTIAHELGHLFLGHLKTNSYLNREGNNTLEYEANSFAAELLMPKEKFLELVIRYSKEGFCDIEKVAEEFGVSVVAASTRGKFLRIFKW